MIKVSVLYPNIKGSKFDMKYYCEIHIPLVEQKLRGSLRRVVVEKGISGGTPGSKPTYIVSGHLIFDSVEAFDNAFFPHADAIMGDIPNYTDIEPIVQVSEILLAH